ncbi:2-phosphosulfolactate phosphatase [Dictyobacter kobayashii]|uniref:Probable 2-phosphosulfolactate phosphatase n=1 Tax=Dictyobacter kobayashii TaxID=2014872 RepID=A0A402AR28_9CHLR|nr:2-phosphosulfolactate phosphatase [Dictyobacter kobayashii]GCE21551.1 hypothetical protein KDK_53510 [Dictyobacter kobayashii]
MLASPNGATCSQYGRQVPFLFVGTLINAEAVAAVVAALLATRSDLAVTIIACGERWNVPSISPKGEEMRVAIEDYLGAGALLSYLPYAKSPEAVVCEGAFRQAKDQLAALLWECGSGRELRARGFEQDVVHASQLNRYQTVPAMRDGAICAWSRADG